MEDQEDLIRKHILPNTTFTRLKVIQLFTDLIETGKLAPGSKIPSVRKIAIILSVSPNTVRKAYKQLQKDRYLTLIPTEGTYVNDVLSTEGKGKNAPWPLHAPYSYRDQFAIYGGADTTGSLPYLSAGSDVPDISILSSETFVNYYRGQKNQYKKNVNVRVKYPEIMNTEINKILLKRNIRVQRGQCIPVPWGFALLLVARMLIRNSECVVLSSASDIQAQRIFLTVGAQLAYTGIDHDGMLISELEKLCLSRQLTAVFLRPAADVPYNVVLSEERRRALIKLSIRYHFVIIAYDDNREFWFQKQLTPLINRVHEGHVIYVSPVSKISEQFKSYELIVATPDFIEVLSKAMLAQKITLEPVYFLAMCFLINGGELEVELRKVMRHYIKTRHAIGEYCSTYLSPACQIRLPAAGLNLWITFNKGLEAAQLKTLLEKHGFDNCMCTNEDLQQPIYGLHLGFGTEPATSWDELFKGISNLF